MSHGPLVGLSAFQFTTGPDGKLPDASPSLTQQPRRASSCRSLLSMGDFTLDVSPGSGHLRRIRGAP